MDFEFAAELPTLETVPTDFQGLYAREGDEGPFKLRSDDVGVTSAVAAIARLNGALKAERAARKSAKGKTVDLSPLSDFGSSPDEIAQAVQTQLAELQGKIEGGEKMKIDLDKIKADLAAGHSRETETLNARNTALQGQLHKLLVNNASLSALGDAIDPDLVMPFISTQVKADEIDGEYVVRVVDQAGDVRYSGATGQPMTINELVKEMKSVDKFKPLFRSEAPEGAGARPGQSSQQVHVVTGTTKSAFDKIKAGLARRN